MELELAKYIGSKVIKAKPMTRGEYNEYRGWKIPENENPQDEGYLVVYVDSDDYVSWSPKDVFERAYRSFDGGMSFGTAIELMKMGFKVARKGWNGKGMWLTMCGAGNYIIGREDACDYNRLPFICMKTADDNVVPWLASQTDMLADDWVVVK